MPKRALFTPTNLVLYATLTHEKYYGTRALTVKLEKRLARLFFGIHDVSIYPCWLKKGREQGTLPSFTPASSVMLPDCYSSRPPQIPKRTTRTNPPPFTCCGDKVDRYTKGDSCMAARASGLSVASPLTRSISTAVQARTANML